MIDRTLNWRPKPDPRSVSFRLSAIPDCWQGAYRRTATRKKTVYLNQGSEGACTGFGCAHALALTPYSKPVDQALAQRLYHEARRQDEWDGEEYEGSSVNGAMKAARLFGLIPAWHWAYSLGEMMHGLSYHGAAEIGVWWWTGMFDPDANGYIHPTGYKEGGHALAVSGYKVGIGFRLENSWGPGWGVNGGCWISETDMQMILDDDGECAFPVKVKS